MIKTKRKLAYLLLASTLVSTLTACGQKPEEVANNGGEKKVTLKFWHIWTSEADSNKKNIEETIKDWNAANPNIQIEAEGIENEAFKTKIKTAISANEAPDIFKSWGAGFSKPFVDADKVLALDEYLNDGTKDKLLNGMLNNLTYNGKVYGLPYTLSTGTLFVNKEMFEKNGIKIPQTFNELLESVKAFRAKGITPMAVGEKDRWPGMFYYNILALREGGAKLSNDALAKKESFEDPAFVAAVEKLKKLVEAQAFDKGALGMTRDESEVPFIQGQVPMYYNGSWFAGSIEKDSSPVKGKVIAMKFPLLEGGKGIADEFLGGAIDGIMVSSNTKYKEQSVKGLKYIAENMSKKYYLTGSGLPTWKFDVDKSKISPLNLQINDLVKDAKGFVPWWDIYLEGADSETHKNLVAEIFGGKINGEEFSKKMQEINKK